MARKNGDAENSALREFLQVYMFSSFIFGRVDWVVGLTVALPCGDVLVRLPPHAFELYAHVLLERAAFARSCMSWVRSMRESTTCLSYWYPSPH